MSRFQRVFSGFLMRLPCARAVIFCIASSVMFTSQAYAGISTIQPLYFGEWIVRDNSSAQWINVDDQGVFGASAGFFRIDAPTNGIYQITGLPPGGNILSITVTPISPMAGCCGPTMAFDNFTTFAADPDPVTGETTLYIGARVTTTGDGSAYPDDTMSGVLQVDFNF